MQDFRKLRVWREAHSLALNAHRVASGIRGATHLSLRSQMIRSAMSIPANIVEGRAQQTDPEFARFLKYAIASAAELEYHIEVARDTSAIEPKSAERLTAQTIEVRKMLYGLVKSIEGEKKLKAGS